MGHTKIDLETFLQIAEVLDVKPYEIFLDESPKNYTNKTDIGNISESYIRELEFKVQTLEQLLAEKEKQIRLQEEMIQMLREKK